MLALLTQIISVLQSILFLLAHGQHFSPSEVVLFCREIKERVKKTKDEKKAKKAEVQSKAQKSQGKGAAGKAAASKGPKLGGGGGKR